MFTKLKYQKATFNYKGGNKLIDKAMMVFSTIALIGVIALVLFDIFFWTPEVLEQRQKVVSFCEQNGFTDFEYTDDYQVLRNQGFCYKAVNGQLEKQGFFIDKQKRILIMDE